MNTELNTLVSEALAEIAAADIAADPQILKTIEVSYLGKKGKLTGILRGLSEMSADEKRTFGMAANEAKQQIADALLARGEEAEQAALAALADTEWIDVSYSALLPSNLGRLHPLSQIIRELESIFTSLGFELLEGSHIETEEFNFDALNIPDDHPARDAQDTFWLNDGRVLRSQTSDTWAHALRDREFPLKGISIGRVFRNEALDASHEHTFHQFEGVYVDRNVSVSHMVSVLQTMLSRIFKKDVTVRLRPGFFPFVEPGYEMDLQCTVCEGKGCSTCKQVGWIELLGCGMIHPNVIRMAGKDPEEWNGFAWGGGLERLIMMRHKISDIRMMHGCDLRDLKQF